MTEELSNQSDQKVRKGFSGLQVVGMVLASMVITVLVTGFLIKIYLFPSPFTPVELSAKESQQLSEKIDRFESMSNQAGHRSTKPASGGKLTPERYSEENMSRQITFTERELNAMVAKNTDLAEKLAIDLAEDLVSIKLLIPLDPDFPMLGGKTLRVRAGTELAYRQGRPIVKLKGISLMGVPMPNAWLGGIKNIDLVKEFGGDEGFWKAFADGVDSIAVAEGSLKIQLKE